MIVSLIVAMEENNGIGFQGHLPWKLSSDQRRFKALTMGHHMVMGRKTWESIGRSLPGRTSVVISKNILFQDQRCIVLDSLEEALHFARQNGESEVFIIGGEQIFILALPIAQRIYLSIVHASLSIDTYFPKLIWEDWSVQSSENFPASETDQYPYTYMVLERTK